MLLNRDDWYETSRDLDWTLSYVDPEVAFPARWSGAGDVAGRRLAGLGRAVPGVLPRLCPHPAGEGIRRQSRQQRAAAVRNLREARPSARRRVAPAHGDHVHGGAHGGDHAEPVLPVRALAALAQPRRLRDARRDPPYPARHALLARPAQARPALRLGAEGLPHQRVGGARGQELLRRRHAQRRLRGGRAGDEPDRRARLHQHPVRRAGRGRHGSGRHQLVQPAVVHPDR